MVDARTPSGTGLRRLAAQARVHAPWRRAFPNRSVRRVVQGTELWMPWSHRLPDYAHLVPDYGQNLVELARRLVPAGSHDALRVLDVGANIGDSTKQILARVDARVLAVEADGYYLDYLRRNVGDDPAVTIAPVLLTTGSQSSVAWTPSRRGGTTHFRSIDASDRAAQDTPSGGTLSVEALVTAYPDFADLRLIKSDTDGHDTTLVPALAAAFRASTPVLFFEYDPALTSTVAGRDAQQVWAELLDLGYTTVGLWGNYGAGLARCRCDDAAAVSAALISTSDTAASYLDVAVVHADDEVGQAALDAMFSAGG